MFSPKYQEGEPRLAKFVLDGGIDFGKTEDLSLGESHL